MHIYLVKSYDSKDVLKCLISLKSTMLRYRVFHTLTSTSVFGDGRISTHADPTPYERISSVTFTSAHFYGAINRTSI